MYVPVTRSSILNAVLHYLTLVSYSALFALSRSTDNVPASCDPARDSEIDHHRFNVCFHYGPER